MTHTPGPWRVLYEEEPGYGLPPLVVMTDEGEDSLYIASVHGGVPGSEKANAHLIAAAPDLLEALEMLAGAPHGSPPLDAFDRARNAIAKARGETDVERSA